jgi:hypothetical protein
MEIEIAYGKLFDRFAEPGDEFGEEWIEKFEENIIEEGEVVGSHSWESDNPGAGAGMTLIYRFRGLIFHQRRFWNSWAIRGIFRGCGGGEPPNTRRPRREFGSITASIPM